MTVSDTPEVQTSKEITIGDTARIYCNIAFHRIKHAVKEAKK